MALGLAPAAIAYETTYGGAEFINVGGNYFVESFSGPSYYDFFGAYGELPANSSEVGAGARHAVSRVGYLRDGDDRIAINEQDPLLGDADFHGVNTATPGVTVGMRSKVGNVLEPGPLPNPARAKTDYFANHVFAATSRGYNFAESQGTGEANDDGIPNNDFWLTTASSAFAGSQWADTWQATQDASISVNFALDGSVHQDDVCASLQCLVILPSGTEYHRSRSVNFSFEATLVVFDLSIIAPCEATRGDCDGEADAPVAIRSVRVVGGQNFAEDADVVRSGGVLDIDLTGSLDFEVIAGHTYYALGMVSVTSEDGAVVDFFNTFGLNSITAPPDALLSDAVLNKGAVLNVNAVPLPGAMWMLMGGLGGLLLRSRLRPTA